MTCQTRYYGTPCPNTEEYLIRGHLITQHYCCNACLGKWRVITEVVIVRKYVEGKGWVWYEKDRGSEV